MRSASSARLASSRAAGLGAAGVGHERVELGQLGRDIAIALLQGLDLAVELAQVLLGAGEQLLVVEQALGQDLGVAALELGDLGVDLLDLLFHPLALAAQEAGGVGGQLTPLAQVFVEVEGDQLVGDSLRGFRGRHSRRTG